MQVTAKHDSNETFKSEKIYGKIFGKGEFHNIVTCLWKPQSQNFFDFLIYFNLFYTYVKAVYTDGKAMEHPHVNESPNTAYIRYNNLKPTLRSVEFLDAIFPVYKQKKSGIQDTPSLISTKDLLKWYYEK